MYIWDQNVMVAWLCDMALFCVLIFLDVTESHPELWCMRWVTI